MTEVDPEQFEAELQTFRPAKPSAESLAKIRAELRTHTKVGADSRPMRLTLTSLRWNRVLGWLVPAAAVAVLAAVLLHFNDAPPKTVVPSQSAAASRAPALKADKVEIDRQFVGDFDAVTELPNGQPLRFRCEQWLDKVSLRDSASGLLIERTTPRVEIVPVRFDTY